MTPTSDVPRPHRFRRLRVRSLLVLVVLVPILGMIGLAGTAASSAMDRRQVAERLQHEVDILSAIVDARVAIAGEETVSAVVSVAADLGADIDTLSELYGTDFGAQLSSARSDVDADPSLGEFPALADPLARLQVVRTTIDEDTSTFGDVSAIFRELTTEIDEIWRIQSRELDQHLATAQIAGTVHLRSRSVQTTFEALSAGSLRASLSIEMLQGEGGPETLRRLIDATSRHETAVERYDRLLGPRASSVAAAHRADPGTERFERTLDELVDDLLAGRPSELTDTATFGEAFIDGAPWGARLSETVRAAAIDLQEEAEHRERQAAQSLWIRASAALIGTLLALACALLLARSVTRPIRRLEVAAHQIHEGRFDLEPIETTGPRELSDTAAAFNEMATTLATVESHAVALADDPEAPFLDHQLPGRTGRALQVALNRLRASIRGAEQHRQALEIAATHDGLTGLLNRTAALTMIERDLARARRAEGSVMALFIDLDGFKGINDEHGHAAGDDALRLTADALRATTRESDVVARLGGDEFLVAGIVVEERSEVELLAERIREAISAVDLVGRAGAIPLRCSIGMALSDDTTADIDALIREADAALYTAKRRGRDQVVWSDRPDASGSSTGLQSPP